MAERENLVKLDFTREKTKHYFLDADGNVLSQLRDKKAADKQRTVLFANAFKREKGYFYFITADNHIARTVTGSNKKKETVSA